MILKIKLSMLGRAGEPEGVRSITPVGGEGFVAYKPPSTSQVYYMAVATSMTNSIFNLPYLTVYFRDVYSFAFGSV